MPPGPFPWSINCCFLQFLCSWIWLQGLDTTSTVGISSAIQCALIEEMFLLCMDFYRSHLPWYILLFIKYCFTSSLVDIQCFWYVLSSFITQIIFLVYTKDKTLTAESQRLHMPSYSSFCDSQPFEKTMPFVAGSCKHWAKAILTHALLRLAINFGSK